MAHPITIKLTFDKANEKIVINSVPIGINIIAIVNIVDITRPIYASSTLIYT